jgi:hypothetical protein
MKILQLSCIAVALAIAGVGEIVFAKWLIDGSAQPADATATGDVTGTISGVLSDRSTLSAMTLALQREPLMPIAGETVDKPAETVLAKLELDNPSPSDYSASSTSPKRDLSYLVYYPYSEFPPVERPTQVALDSLSDVPVGTPIEEIKRASDIFGLDFNFMKAVAKVESGFDPKQRTGSYIGLFQLSNYEFAKYGSGDILNPRDNAIAAAYKFITEGVLFEWQTHKKPTLNDLYLIHQQGWQGAAEHIAHPGWIAWKSMCDTDEGREKGEKWCRRAIWGNTLPAIKHIWKSVDNLTSAAFVNMWRQRIDALYAHYSEASVEEAKR